ncbi:MAG: hypothetical protein NC320_01340 [Clostridium sp.]|nr:hypothetical protein [Clostridium sp.]MCM1547815.1 hypothetical protein [Ruminococcus sp.]
MKQKLKNILFAVIIITAFYFCLAYPFEIGRAVSAGIERCISIIIPSMFIFMCLTAITASTGLHGFLCLPLSPVAKYIFRLDKKSFGIFIMSMFSGYPAGIKLLTDSLHKNEITKKEFDRLSCFCFAGGPAFISGTVSGLLFPNTQAGMLCFISVTAGNIVTAAASGFFSDKPSKNTDNIKLNISADSIIDSTLSSSGAILRMCVMITAFSGIYKAAELSGIIGILSNMLSKLSGLDCECSSAVISAFFEISRITDMPRSSAGLLPIICALLSFGGICVLIQVITLSKGILNVKKFLAARVISASVSAIVCRVISSFFDLGAISVSAYRPVQQSKNILPAILIFGMTAMLLSLSKSYVRSDEKSV